MSDLIARLRGHAKFDDLFGEAADEIERLTAYAETLERGIRAVEELIGDSRGVYGLHRNGDVSPWDELRTSGRFEEWLLDFDAALDAIPDEVNELVTSKPLAIPPSGAAPDAAIYTGVPGVTHDDLRIGVGTELSDSDTATCPRCGGPAEGVGYMADPEQHVILACPSGCGLVKSDIPRRAWLDSRLKSCTSTDAKDAIRYRAYRRWVTDSQNATHGEASCAPDGSDHDALADRLVAAYRSGDDALNKYVKADLS
jgi:hypothetical protein